MQSAGVASSCRCVHLSLVQTIKTLQTLGAMCKRRGSEKSILLVIAGCFAFLELRRTLSLGMPEQDTWSAVKMHMLTNSVNSSIFTMHLVHTPVYFSTFFLLSPHWQAGMPKDNLSTRPPLVTCRFKDKHLQNEKRHGLGICICKTSREKRCEICREKFWALSSFVT